MISKSCDVCNHSCHCPHFHKSKLYYDKSYCKLCTKRKSIIKSSLSAIPLCEEKKGEFKDMLDS
jgi:hypothetical protein